MPRFVGHHCRSRRTSVATIRLAVILSLAPALCFSTRRSAASTVVVPPVTITRLDHLSRLDGYVFDTITIPGPGYTSSGFTATITTGDVISIRFQAAPGKKFVVHPPVGSETRYFFFNAYWPAAGESVSHVDPHTLTFENLQGKMPTEIYSLVAIGDNGNVVMAIKQYVIQGSFEFTAIAIEIVASQPLVPATREFSDVRSSGSPSWGTSVYRPGTNGPLMEIVDAGVVATQRSSWGRLKSLYR